MKTLWDRDDIQFPRLLAEIRAAGLTPEQYRDLSVSMDLPPGAIDVLLERAEDAFEKVKDTCPPEEGPKAKVIAVAREIAQSDIGKFHPAVAHHVGDLREALQAMDARESEHAATEMQEALPAYYECGICSQYHAASWTGDCRQDDARFNVEDLDRVHDVDGWREVAVPGSEDCQKLTSSTEQGYSCAEENGPMSDTKAIKKLKSLLEDKDKDGKTKESVSSLAIKLGIARGTLLGIVSGTSQPRLDVILAAKKIGIRQEDWS